MAKIAGGYEPHGSYMIVFFYLLLFLFPTVFSILHLDLFSSIGLSEQHKSCSPARFYSSSLVYPLCAALTESNLFSRTPLSCCVSSSLSLAVLAICSISNPAKHLDCVMFLFSCAHFKVEDKRTSSSRGL